MKVSMRVQLLVFLLAVWILTIVCTAIGAEEPENLAFEMPVTGSGGIGQGAYELLVDGLTATDPYLGGPVWVQIDLGDEFVIDTIKVWHYWGDGRTYKDNKIALSKDDFFMGEEVVVFDTNDTDAEYPETAEGKEIKFDPTEAQYIRAWVGGSTANEFSHWVELQAFFVGTQSVEPMEKLPTTWGRMKMQ